MMNLLYAGLFGLALMLTACSEPEPVTVGMLASDRVELVADVSEPLTAIHVTEGQWVEAGQLVLEQDSSRLQVQLDEARAGLRRAEAVLAEQVRGPRPERIAVARAEVSRDEQEQAFREREWQRQVELLNRNVGTPEALDQSRIEYDLATARLEASQARLDELIAGTTAEELEQARQQVQEVEASIARLELDIARLQIRAPATAYVDSLPFEPGEQPQRGAVLAVLLTGPQPHARVYVPEALRVHVQSGDAAVVYVDGISEPLNGTVRRIANDAAFTPYYSLTERDRGRLSYVAEIALPDGPRRLPDGVPVEVRFPAAGPSP